MERGLGWSGEGLRDRGGASFASEKSRSPALDPGPVCGTAYAGFDLMDLAEDEDFFVEVPVDGVGVVDEVPQDLGVVGGGHD